MTDASPSAATAAAPPESAMDERWWSRLRWILPIGFVLCYLVPLGVRDLAIPDEVRYAEMSREMVESGDWVVPRLLGLRYFEKPIGGYWLNSLSVLLFGENAFAVRLPSALATGASALLLMLLARRATGDARKGVLAALVYLTSLMIFGMGTFAVMDGMLTMFLTAALYAFWRAFSAASGRGRAGWWALFGAACGAAFLVKGFVALAVPFVAFVPLMLWQRRWRELLVHGSLAVVVAFLVALPWGVAIHLREGDFWNFFFFHEHIRRFAAEDAQHAQPFWFYVPILLGMTVPWTAVAPGALRAAWRGARQGESFQGFLLLALVMPFLLFSYARGKLPTYVLPCYGPLAVLMACAIVDALDRGSQRALRAGARLNLGLGLVLLLALVMASILFQDEEYLRQNSRAPWLLGLVLVAWSALSAATLLRRIPYVLGTAGLLLCVLPVLFMGQLTSVSWRQQMLDELARSTDTEPALASASVRLSPAVAWEFRRDDVVIVGGKSELKYGLGYPDARGRFFPDPDFPAWLEEERARRPVLLFLLGSPEKGLRTYPAPDRVETNGNLTVFTYDERPG